jgi:methanethiol S-methyltransferase
MAKIATGINRTLGRNEMGHTDTSAYGLWSLVIINSLVFIIFAFSFAKPQSPRDWRSFGAFSAFLVALFTEMYGFPLTIYLLSGWLTSKFPGVDFLSHDAGHLLEVMFGWKSNPHFGPFHILSSLFIGGGFWLLAAAWKVLYVAQRTQTLARTGPYTKIRHPQYVGFILIMFGFLLQWPTLVTLIMFPILVYMYVHLAFREEKEVRSEFGEEYAHYAKRTPAFIPDLGKPLRTSSDGQ